MGIFENNRGTQLEGENSIPMQGNPPQQEEKIISDAPDGHEYPSGIKLFLIMASIFVAMFLVALDKLIISTVTSSIRYVKLLNFSLFISGLSRLSLPGGKHF